LLDSAAEKLEELKKKMKKFKRLEKNLEPSSSELKDYLEKRKLHENERTKLEVNLQAARDETSRAALMGEAPIEDDEKDKKSKRKSNKNKEEDVTVQTTKGGKKKVKDQELEDELFKDIYAAQDESLAIVQRLISKSDETIDIAQESQEMLSKQREQLQRIDEKMDELGSNITRGRKELVSFLRKLACDKMIMIIAVIVLLCIIALIIFLIIKPYLPKINVPTPSPPAPSPTPSVRTIVELASRKY
jgi:t-SNARE complex subunit (syntaxin)